MAKKNVPVPAGKNPMASADTKTKKNVATDAAGTPVAAVPDAKVIIEGTAEEKAAKIESTIKLITSKVEQYLRAECAKEGHVSFREVLCSYPTPDADGNPALSGDRVIVITLGRPVVDLGRFLSLALRTVEVLPPEQVVEVSVPPEPAGSIKGESSV